MPAHGPATRPPFARNSSMIWAGRGRRAAGAGTITGVDYLLAQVNIGRMLAPLDRPQLADFVAALEPVNGGGGRGPGLPARVRADAVRVHAARALPAAWRPEPRADAQPGRLDLPRLTTAQPPRPLDE
jgi:hypothetical protein